MEMNGSPERGPHLTEEEAGRVLNSVLEVGINLIDTAGCYGLSEERIGRHIGHRRDEYFLASKCGCVPGTFSGAEHLNTTDNVRAGVEQSLRLLRTDHLDLVQFHNSLTPDAFDAEGGLSELVQMRDEGKLRFIGVSGTLPNLLEQIGMGIFDTYQVP
jgi:aryl-alcohol dehydrogenase-like predicted oxidoreductase